MGEAQSDATGTEPGDPLDSYRADVDPTLKAIYREADGRDERVLKDWAKGGPPVLLTREALWFADDDRSFRIPKDEIRQMGETRSTNYTAIRWGIASFLTGILAIPFIDAGPLAAIGSGALMLLGGFLVVKGFLAKAILVQADDDRLPPFVIDHRKFSSIRRALQRWDDGD
jgi:hypothetical protein